MTREFPKINSLTPILDELVAELPTLIESTCAEIFQEQTSYGSVTQDSLAESITRNMTVAISALTNGEAPQPKYLDAAAKTAIERHKSGVPLDQVILAFRISISQIHDSFVAKAAGRMSPSDFAQSTGILWKVGDSFVNRVVETYHDLEVEKALNSEVQRIATVQSLLNGEILEQRVLQSLGLDEARDYAVIVCEIESLPQPEREAFRVQVENTGFSDARGGVVIIENATLTGILDRTPSVPSYINAGMSPFLPLAKVEAAFDIARTCVLANRTSPRSVGTMETLTWRLATVSNPSISNILTNRYINPCLLLGEPGIQLLETIQTWLCHSKKVTPTAEQLHLHVNTVRYRIEKFSTLTGFDQEDGTEIVDVLWALESWMGHNSQNL